MNECFTDPIFGNFSAEKKRETRQVERGQRTEERLRQRLVIK